MKKIIMSRRETNYPSPPIENGHDYATIAAAAMPPAPVAAEKKEETKKTVQPPLPLDPPPPSVSPPILPMPLKQEIDDSEYQNGSSDETEPNQNDVGFPLENSPEGTPEINGKPQICRDFVRGTCTRIGTCRFSHKADITQLNGVYTFCRNFQNRKTGCNLVSCRYVHATVFEEQHFYRTGHLPPHALSHHKKKNVLPPPPPPPEDSSTTFTNPPPRINPVVPNQTAPVIAGIPLVPIVDNLNTTNPVSPLKREWNNETEEFNTSPRELETKEVKKRCKNCDTMEYRFEYHQKRYGDMMKTSEDLEKKIDHVSKKNKKLLALMGLLKTVATNSKGVNSNVHLSPVVSNEKEKQNMLEALLKTSNLNRLSMNGDNNMNLLGRNFSNMNLRSLMAKLFQCNEQNMLFSDVSRDQ